MKILILGGDGYLGWPQVIYLSQRGHQVAIIDNLSRRMIDIELSSNSLIDILPLPKRVDRWLEVTGNEMDFQICDITDYSTFSEIVKTVKPDAIVHFAEQRSAPYSMIDQKHASFTMQNNIIGTLNVLYAIKEYAPDCHLVKLGTMGEYGTPNIDIEEGFIEIEYKGRRDKLPYPKQAGSFYHLTKVHDSNNIMFACRTWNIRATDLNQGVVYGLETDETSLDKGLATRFDYDHIYGTVLNRFCCQVVTGHPMTVYGTGQQTRGYINIKDTIRCIELAINNPALHGEYRVFNQITEQFSVLELARKVKKTAKEMGINSKIEHIDNPRVEQEQHYYNVAHTKLRDLGLEPNLLTGGIIKGIIDQIGDTKNIDTDLFYPTITWI